MTHFLVYLAEDQQGSNRSQAQQRSLQTEMLFTGPHVQAAQASQLPGERGAQCAF